MKNSDQENDIAIFLRLLLIIYTNTDIYDIESYPTYKIRNFFKSEVIPTSIQSLKSHSEGSEDSICNNFTLISFHLTTSNSIPFYTFHYL